MASKKKLKRGHCFLPESLEEKQKKTSKSIDEVKDAIRLLKDIELDSLNDANLGKDEALLLLASKVTFVEVLNLKLALEYVPRSLNYQEKGATEYHSE